MKKAQVEIVGLLLIVILISFVLIFAIKYMSEPPNDVTNRYKAKDLSSSFVGAMLNSNSGCTDDTLMSKVLIDCVKHSSIGGSNELICQGNRKTCEYAEDVLDDMLTGTLDAWNRDYEFIIVDHQNQRIIERHSADAKPRANVIPFIQPLPIDTSGSRSLKIILCIGGLCPSIF